jgi:hypothetical protein
MHKNLLKVRNCSAAATFHASTLYRFNAFTFQRFDHFACGFAALRNTALPALK